LSRQWTTEQGRMQQPTIDGSGKGKQWLATTRVRGQQLAIVAKRGRQPEERLPWPKRSERGIGGGRGILDLDSKGQITRGSGKTTGGGTGR
jgi:hypothetical protein